RAVPPAAVPPPPARADRSTAPARHRLEIASESRPIPSSQTLRADRQAAKNNDSPDNLMIDCALFEPDIPQNAGTILRLGACFGVRVHIVHPSGFALTDRNFKRAGMDYLSR